MAETINGVPIGDLPGIGSVPDDSMLVVEFLGKAYHMPGAVLRQMIQDVLDSMGDSVDDVTEARLTAAIETVLASGKYNGVSPSVEVLDEEDGTTVIHIIDAFGDKRYPVEVKGATDAVRYKPQSLTDAQKKQARENIDVSPGTITVKLSGSVTGGFDVVLNGESVTNEPLDRLAEEGYRVVGVAISEVKVLNYKVPAGTLFEYTNVFEFEDNSVVGSQNTRRFVFRVQVDDCNFTLRCTDGVWGGILQPIQATFFLKRNNGAPFIQYNGKTILPEDANWLSVQLILCEVQHRPVFCFQGDMQFFTDNNTAIQPPWGTAFSLRINDDNDYYFATEYDGYELQLLISPDGFVNSARKTSVYKAVESKADDLKAEDGTLFLLSAGEPIGAGVPLPTGNADDSKIFIADLNTSTYEDIKAADDAGKICYALWGGYTPCMLTTLSGDSAIFTTLLDPHLGKYVKFTKGTVGVSDFGLTESHSVLYEPQSLTDAQKAQARENIGALSADDIDVDSIGSNVFVGNYDTVTFTEIKTAHDAGRVCFLDFKGIPFLLLGVDDTEALFVREMNENQDYEVTITADGGKSFKILDKNIIDVYVAGLFSAKYAEAKAAYEAGKACFVTYGALLCPLIVLDAEKAEFVGMLTPHIGMKGTLYADGTYNFQYVHSNAVQTVDQSLTDDQKAQARTNIGALSTGDVDTVLQQAKDSGLFDGKDGQDGKDGYTPVKGKDYFDGANGKTAYAYAQDGGYTGTEAEFAAKLASGSEPLKVTLSGNDTDGYTADKTVAEIYAARTAGRDVYMVGGAVTYQLSYLNGSFAAFSYTMASRNAIEIISVIMMSGLAPTRIHQTIDDSYVKYTAQSLDEEYKLQARTNIGAAAAADIATTKYASTSTANTSYFKISDFGSWGTGAWYQKGFSMLITSRAGETVWFSLSANDSATTARAFRLMNTYSKIAGVYYSVSENAVYVKAAGWCNNVTAHILSNIGGDYVPTVASVSGLASDVVEVNIIEFGPASSGLAVGDSSTPLLLGGSATRPTYNGTDMALSSDLSSYLPLSGGLMTGSLKFQDSSLPQKSLEFVCGIDAFASGGEMGWQSKAEFLSGYLTTTGTAARATADANGNNIANTYAKVTTANDYDGEQRFKNSAYCPTITDTAPGIGCAFKASRGMVNELLADKIIATASTGKIPFYSYTGASNGSMSGLTEFAYLSPGAFILRPPSGEGGQIQLEAAANDPTNTGICIDTAGGNFRIFGLQSADGTTTTGYGSVLAIHPYAKVITGGYSFDGLAAKATADANGNNIASTYAKLKTYNDFVHDGNEITMVPAGYSHGGLYFNYRTASGQYDGNINNYVFCNGKGGSAGVTLTADSFSGTAARATADGNGRNIVSTYATKDEVVTAANGSLKVTLSGNDTDGYTVDKTFAEIRTAWEAGRYVYVTNGVIVCNPCYFSASLAAVFSYTRATGDGVEVWSVMVNNLGTKPTVVKKTITA